MSNERLRSQLAARGLTPSELAARVQVDPKTVERWITTGRTPHRTHRWRVGSELDVDEAYLWPDAQDDERARAASTAELVALYPHRGAVPADLWRGIVEQASDRVDLLVYAGLFWFDAHPDLVEILAERAAGGVRVRLAFGDPDSEAVAARGVEEGIDMPGRVRMTLGLVAPLLDTTDVEVRLHATTLYTSMYRADSRLLVNPHTYGSPAAQSPVLHLHQVPGGRLVGHYLRSFERVWESGRPYGHE